MHYKSVEGSIISAIINMTNRTPQVYIRFISYLFRFESMVIQKAKKKCRYPCPTDHSMVQMILKHKFGKILDSSTKMLFYFSQHFFTSCGKLMFLVV